MLLELQKRIEIQRPQSLVASIAWHMWTDAKPALRDPQQLWDIAIRGYSLRPQKHQRSRHDSLQLHPAASCMHILTFNGVQQLRAHEARCRFVNDGQISSVPNGFMNLEHGSALIIILKARLTAQASDSQMRHTGLCHCLTVPFCLRSGDYECFQPCR